MTNRSWLGRRAMAACLAGAACIGAWAGAGWAGPLVPPAGPVASTPGPEPRTPVNAQTTPGDADSVFQITQPGSYYLTGNINAGTGRHGIEISASGVTLDLNGFDISGAGGTGGFDGVRVTLVSLVNVAIRNGSVRGFSGDGVDTALTTVGVRIDDVRAHGNSGSGIVAGTGSVVTGCSATMNGQSGILVGTSSVVADCTARVNAAVGISGGINVVIRGCSSQGNSSHGIATSGTAGHVSACVASGNGGDGINMTSGATVIASTAYSNSGRGIAVANGSLVVDCSARVNGSHGISAQSNSHLRGNTCSVNGQNMTSAGIFVSGTEALIDGNNCASNARGIEVTGQRSIITRNRCSSNTTNWVIGIGNAVAPIVNTTANAAAISGNTYTGSLGSTDPNANFTH